MMIYEVLKREKPYFQSKIQRYYIRKVKLFVSTVPEETVTPLFLDIGNGRVFGKNVEVEIHLYDRPEFSAVAECLAAQFTIACYPWISDVRVNKNLEDALKDADYLLIFPRLSDANISVENAISEQFNFLSTMAIGMDKYAKLTSKAVVVGKHESLFCHMMAVFLKEIPWNQITGLTRNLENKVTALLSKRLKVPTRQISGVTVLGENVVDVNMAYVNMEDEMIEVINLEDLKKADNGSYEMATFNKGKIENPFEGEDEKISEFAASIRKMDHTDCFKCQNVQEHLNIMKMPETQVCEMRESSHMTKEPEIKSKYSAFEDQSQVKSFYNEDIEEPFALLNRFESSEHDVGKPKEIYQLGTQPNLRYSESDYYVDKGNNPIPLSTVIRRMAEQRRKDRLKENYFYENSHLKNVISVAAAVDDIKWLYDTLPKVCENMFATEGASTARSLSEHLRLLQSGTEEPFSIMTCSLGAFGFPHEMFLSGPAKVDPKSKDVVFWQEYEMHERVRIILMKQIMQLKAGYDIFKDYLSKNHPPPSIAEPVPKEIKEYVPVVRKKVKKPKKSLSEESVGAEGVLGYEAFE